MILNPSLRLQRVRRVRFGGSPAAEAVPAGWGDKVSYRALTSPLA